MGDEAGTGGGGSWLVEPPAPEEFRVMIRKGSAVEIPESVRAAIDELQRALEAAEMVDDVAGFAAADWCIIHTECTTFCANKTGIAARGGVARPGGSSGTAAPGAGPARPGI